jgi:hypothetical protein
MNIHTQDDANRFIDRFYGFSDSLIRAILLQYLEGGIFNLEISIATRDSLTHEDSGWVCVKILMQNIKEVLFRQNPHMTNQLISHGIHLQQYDNMFGLEFGGAADAPRTLSELRTSDAYTVASTVAFEIEPY